MKAITSSDHPTGEQAATRSENRPVPGLSAPPAAQAPADSPRTVIRGESSPYMIEDDTTGERSIILPARNKSALRRLVKIPASGIPACAALTDWLNCTIPHQGREWEAWEFLTPILEILGKHFSPVEPLGHGLHGWTEAFRFGESGARFAKGGQLGTAFLSLSGEACSLLSSPQWEALGHFLSHAWNARITRWDGAVDDFLGVHSVDSAVDLFKAGLFSAGGRSPTVSQHGDWLTGTGGRTFEVGKRKNGKMLRVYEKGIQLGDPGHPWVRWEVELHNKDREIPWEVLTNPGPYFVGAFPKALTWATSEMNRIKTVRATCTRSYEHAVAGLRSQYGPLLEMMMQVEHDAATVVSKVTRPARPGRFSHPLYERPGDVCK